MVHMTIHMKLGARFGKNSQDLHAGVEPAALMPVLFPGITAPLPERLAAHAVMMEKNIDIIENAMVEIWFNAEPSAGELENVLTIMDGLQGDRCRIVRLNEALHSVSDWTGNPALKRSLRRADWLNAQFRALDVIAGLKHRAAQLSDCDTIEDCDDEDRAQLSAGFMSEVEFYRGMPSLSDCWKSVCSDPANDSFFVGDTGDKLVLSRQLRALASEMMRAIHCTGPLQAAIDATRQLSRDFVRIVRGGPEQSPQN